MKNKSMRSGLMATTTICGLLTGIIVTAAPTGAFAQAADKKDEKVTEVIVTGSILRKKNLTSISPLTTITAVDLEKRGVTTVESALQNVAGNNGGAMNNNWSAGGGFAAGASGLSLRGLTSNSTLVLVDGMRLAYYPLADDATRNFVDLNTIPDAIVDRVEVLQDGASSTYGADAIAGVVNVITKKNFHGFTAKATMGAREGKGGGVTALSGTWGMGDLGSDGYNLYVSGEYQKNEAFTFAQADAPWNTADQSGYCAPSSLAANSVGVDASGKTCRTNGIINGIQFDDTFAGVGSTTVAIVRPYDATNTTPISGGKWQLLNPTAGCGDLKSVTITANEARRLSAASPAQTQQSVTGATVCQQDLVNQYNTIQPQDTRKSISARLTKRFSDTTEGYIAANFYQNEVYYMGRSGPKTIQSVTTPGTAGSVATLAGIALPVYVCPVTTVGNCTSASTGSKLNPNNPFAASNQMARINYTFGDIPFYVNTNSQNFRVAAGLKGVALGWNYDLNMTAMQSKLTYTRHGVPNLQHILDVVKDGSYNFVTPSLNTQAVRDYVSPVSIQNSDSEMVDIEANASKALMSLAGGPMQLGVGAAFRYERVKNPSANPDPVGGNKYDRYSNGINPFGATGFRNVQSVFFELDAPLTEKLDVNFGGRVDSYSTKFANFSPKIQSSYKVSDNLMLRGSFSKGFRAPSIAENNSDPSTGFVTLSVPDASAAAFKAAHGNDGYGFTYSLGKTTVAAKGLKPETSENTTVGGVWTPTKWLGVSMDYYIIHKRNIIQGGDPTAAINAYYAGQPTPAGFVVIPGVPDPLYPTALPTIGYVQYTLVNLNSQDTAGLDFSVSGRFNLGPVKWNSILTGSYMQYYTQTYPGGVKQSYAGTLGNNTITSGSGTPKRRANWQNSFDFGKFNVSATAYYVDGYKTVAADNGDNVYAPCITGTSTVASTTSVKYRDGATVVKCDVEAFSNVDLHGTYKVNANYSITLDVLNAFDSHSPYDPSGTYGGPLYNPAFTATGIMGRYWKLSAKVTY